MITNEAKSTKLTPEQIANQLGCEVSQVESMLKSIQYRKEYSARPEVKEKRKAYSAERNARLSMLKELLKGE